MPFARPDLTRLRAVASSPMFEAVSVAVVFFCTVAYRAISYPTAFNNYVLLADAWIDGRSWIKWPGDWIDAVPFHGRPYLIQAPFPAVLMIPQVMISRADANQSLMTAIIFAIGCGTVAWIARKLGFERFERMTFVFFFAFGTSFFFGAWRADLWYYAGVVTATFTLLALAFLLNEGKPEFIVFFALCAGFSRYSLLPVTALYVAYLFATRDRRLWTRITLESLSVIVPVAALYIWYNYARWGVPYDIGYPYYYRMMVRGNLSAFTTQSFEDNVITMFTVPPALLSGFPFVEPPRAGPGLLWTAWPALAAFWARRPKPLVIFLWAATVTALIPNLFYWNHGDDQFGSRHALDYFAFVLVLMMLALRQAAPRWLFASMLAMSVFSIWLMSHYKYFL